MKDRLSKISKRATHALCLLAACGLTYSCADEYKLDDENPTWLGSSIYNYLEEKGNYTNVLRLIDDLGLKDVLSTTGSRTLFVANDSAFQRFYDQNAAAAAVNPNAPWGNATSYDKLSESQKKLLLHSATLNNAYLMEMLSRSEGTVQKGANMRKITSVELTDSIPVLKESEFPFSYSSIDKNYWTQHKSKDKFYVVSDNSTPMMVFFTDDFMSKANMTDDDFKFIVGQDHEFNQYYIYDNKVINKDITCQNGYIHELENVLIPQPNMAELIRNSGNSDIYSHILDRFSAPYYDANLTTQYRENIDKNFKDSIFVRKYYSQITNTTSISDYLDGGNLVKGPDGESPSSDFRALKLDPAWNQYVASGNASEDMAAMFVPTDDALLYYFRDGEGKDIYANYAKDINDRTLEGFYKNIDSIPMSILNSLVSNLMQKSFVESVPSKFTTILDQANDNLFTSVDETKQHITDVQIANNGVVYFMDKVYPPVDYAAVTSPAYVGKDYKVMKFAIYNGEGSDLKNNMLNLNFYAYLRAKGDGINFSFFLPSDQALQNYVDPISIIPEISDPQVKARVLSFTYNANKSTSADEPPLDWKQYSYDPLTGQKGSREIVGSTVDKSEVINRLADILETHTVVHNTKTEPNGINSGNEYYLSKSGSPIRVRKAANGKYQIQGGMQIDNETNHPNLSGTIPGYYYAETQEIYEKTNGTTYCLNAPIQQAVKSAYRVMNEMGNQKFFDLCNGVDLILLEKVGLIELPSDATQEEQNRELEKYSIFFKNSKYLDQNVAFFTKFNYTIYVPTDAALEEEIDTYKLPTWESIQNYVTTYEDDPKWESEYKLKAKAQVTILLNFIRGHFQDNTLFADQNAGSDNEYNSATLDDNGEKFITISSKQDGGGRLLLKKSGYYDCKVTNKKNLIARDYITSIDYDGVNTNLKYSTITSSAYSVLHEIDGVLRTVKLGANEKYKTYEDKWKDTQAAQKTVASFHIKNK